MSTTPDPQLARLAVRTIQFLAVDAVEQADSGHPGMPMGAADVAFVLWSRFLRYDPTRPQWADRDRFVLSAGHGCMLLYGLLHLAGYELSLDELKRFRQWESKTPGHPEFGMTVGVEATTGPLGQGVGNAAGMALAAKMLAARCPADGGFHPVSHRVFALASDGDLMEGISGEASSLAGHLRLGNLVVLYDDNRITIEGETRLAFSEDVARRYEGYGWHAQRIDGHDHEAIAAAIEAATAERDRPSLVVCRTHIAKGAPNKQDTAESHGSPLGADEVAATKRGQDWPAEPTFHIPDEVRAFFQARAAEGAALRTAWEGKFEQWRQRHAEAAALWDAIWRRGAPDDIVEQLIAEAPDGVGATRAHGGAVLQLAAARVPALVGGSADLAPSTKTVVQGSPSVAPGEYAGRNLHFGVREHAMGAMLNGFLYHGAFRPYGATFLVFSDYMRPAIRLAALSGLPAIYVFTHDSIFVGEDGPTHQPVEQLDGLRVIPGLTLFRPADGVETAMAYAYHLERAKGPVLLSLTRQAVAGLERPASFAPRDVWKGAYIVSEPAGKPGVVLLATGSEVSLAVEAAAVLAEDGLRVRVVSMPSVELFLEQAEADQDAILPDDGTPIIAIEAGRGETLRRFVGRRGLVIGMESFGASAPYQALAEHFGFTADSVAKRVKAYV